MQQVEEPPPPPAKNVHFPISGTGKLPDTVKGTWQTGFGAGSGGGRTSGDTQVVPRTREGVIREEGAARGSASGRET